MEHGVQGLIDIHCHILPEIDDGASDIETSIRMLKMAVDDGVTHIVATPHFMYNEKPDIHDIKKKFESLREKIKEKNIPLTLLSGADIRLTYELLSGIQRNEVPTINNTRYFLLELPDLVPPHFDDFLFEVKLKGFIPIITHPERNYSLFSSPDKIADMRNSGALIQITAMSITGEFGSQIKKASNILLKKGFVDFVASDAHSANRRNPVLSKAYREITGLLDEQQAKRLFYKNPLSVIEDRDII